MCEGRIRIIFWVVVEGEIKWVRWRFSPALKHPAASFQSSHAIILHGMAHAFGFKQFLGVCITAITRGCTPA